MPEQPLTPEHDYALYLLDVSADGALPALRFLMPRDGYWDVTWMERQERASLYALGRIRESLCHRIKRLSPDRPDEMAFLRGVLSHCQGEDGGKVIAPRWPAQSLGTVVGMLRDRLQARRIAA